MTDYKCDDGPIEARTPDEWAMLVALSIDKEHGHNGPAWIAGKLSEFAVDGNITGIATLKEVARAYEKLLTAKAQSRH